MDQLSEIIEIIRSLSSFGDLVRGLVGLSTLYGVWAFFQGHFYKRVNLSIGSFKIVRKDYDVQKITNVVSAKFYGGGPIPAEVREEIINQTMPKIKELQIKKDQSK